MESYFRSLIESLYIVQSIRTAEDEGKVAGGGVQDFTQGKLLIGVTR